MEHTLRCNALKCRMELNHHAVVTTCSHIFCIDCANRLQLSNPPPGQRPVCPACEAHLTNPDDAVITNLNPTEDYKTSVLSGLSPNIIMECAGRALSFWAYQTTQEVVYQEFLARSLTDKYTSLNSQMDKIIHDANTEITDLRVKMDNMLADQVNLRRKNEELAQAFREKSRKYLQTQELYDKLKRRAMLGQVQSAASDAVHHTIQASAVSNHFIDHTTTLDQNPRQPSLLSDLQGNTMQQCHNGRGDGIALSMPPPAARGEFTESWNHFSSKESDRQNDPTQTPSSHRQRLTNGSNFGMGLAGLQTGRATSAPLSQRRVASSREPFTSLSPNGANNFGFAGYGMSAGMKVSQPPAVVQGISGGGRPTIRSRVAQRQGSATFMNGRTSTFGPAPGVNVIGKGAGYY